MRRLLVIAVLAVTALGCQRREPEKLDLNQDTSDSASKIMSGKKVDPRDLMPKDGK